MQPPSIARHGEMSESRPEPSTRADYSAFRTIPTRWMDNDAYGHMNNVVHYSLFDTAVNGWLIENNLLDINNSTEIGLVVETGCRYFAEMAFPDIITAGLRVAHLGKSSVRYEIALFRNEEVKASAEGFFVHVYVNRKTRKAAQLNPALRAALESLQK